MYLPHTTLPESASVWVFYDNKTWSESTTVALEEEITDFCKHWTSHEVPIPCSFLLIARHILVILADQHTTPIGGCAKDVMYNTIETFGKTNNINFFCRDILVYQQEETPTSFKLKDIKEKIRSNYFDEQALFLDNNIKMKKDLPEIKKRLNPSWLSVSS